MLNKTERVDAPPQMNPFAKAQREAKPEKQTEAPPSGRLGTARPNLISLVPAFNRREQIFEAVERNILFGIEHLPKIVHGIRDVFEGAGQGGAAGIGVAAALKFLRQL